MSRRVANSSLEEFTRSETTRRQSALVDAWSLFSTLTPGNSGKREAIELISNEGKSLEGIDLSCQRMGGGWDEEERSCRRPVLLVDLVLGRPGEIDGETVDGRFRGNLTGANLQGANLTGAILTDAYLGDVNFSGANLFAADLSNSGISGADFRGAQLTGTNFEGVKPPISANYPNHNALFVGSWAWSHDPPIGLVGVEVRLCNWLPGNNFSERPSNC